MTPTDHLAHTAPTSDDYRRVLGTFPTGVTVVTSTSTDGTPIGFTCQSFASISLDPQLIMISVMHSSRSLPTLLAHGSFTVNILRSGDGALARKFAADPAHRFTNTPLAHDSDARHPVLSGAVAWIDCDVHHTVEAGDHTIVLARVRALSDQPAEPLVWVNGGFRELAVA